MSVDGNWELNYFLFADYYWNWPGLRTVSISAVSISACTNGGKLDTLIRLKRNKSITAL